MPRQECRRHSVAGTGCNVLTRLMYLGAHTGRYARHVLCISLHAQDVTFDTSYCTLVHAQDVTSCTGLLHFAARRRCCARHVLCTSVPAQEVTLDSSSLHR